MMHKYLGITYPKLFFWNWQYWIWRKIMCKRDMHLFDEVLSGGSPWEHYLCCDACQLMVHIVDIDHTQQYKLYGSVSTNSRRENYQHALPVRHELEHTDIYNVWEEGRKDAGRNEDHDQ